MRLSDILKKTPQKHKEQETAPQAAVPVLENAEKFNHEPVVATKEPSVQQNPSSAEAAYTKAILEIKNIISSVEKGSPYTADIESVPMLVELVRNDNIDILVLADRSTPDIFIYGHCVNMCILSLFLGRGFSFPKDKMINLGLCALLSDIGLAKTHQDPGQRATNPAGFINLLPGLPEDVKVLLLQIITKMQNKNTEITHGTDIFDFTRVIAIANAYETLTHIRPGKDRILPHEALKNIIGMAGQEFDSEIVRLFLERMSLYPPGSYVKLNSDEIGKVVGLNKGLPTRPKIKLMINASSQRLAEPKMIDLASNPMLFVKEAIDETRQNLPDKKLALELKASRWWVKGL